MWCYKVPSLTPVLSPSRNRFQGVVQVPARSWSWWGNGDGCLVEKEDGISLLHYRRCIGDLPRGMVRRVGLSSYYNVLWSLTWSKRKRYSGPFRHPYRGWYLGPSAIICLLQLTMLNPSVVHSLHLPMSPRLSSVLSFTSFRFTSSRERAGNFFWFFLVIVYHKRNTKSIIILI